MGNWLSSVYRKIFQRLHESRILFLGLDAAGKTTILDKLLKLGEVITTIPTIGCWVETVDFNNVRLTAWDFSSRNYNRVLWKNYVEGISGLIIVVDSKDNLRIPEIREEFVESAKMYPSSLLKRDLPILVLANKQDLPGCLSAEEVKKVLDLESVLVEGQPLYVQGCVAVTGEGLREGLEWLTTCLKTKHND
jgi:small GTP-binding protein